MPFASFVNSSVLILCILNVGCHTVSTDIGVTSHEASLPDSMSELPQTSSDFGSKQMYFDPSQQEAHMSSTEQSRHSTCISVMGPAALSN